MASRSRYEDDRKSDRRRHSRSRSPSPQKKEKRSDDQLPEQFGRESDDAIEDNRNVLQKMKDSFKDSPLSELQKCIDGSRKIKVYTRNFKEVRGICTGYVLAFDKHWNLILVDADEAYLRPRAAKTPYLEEVDADKPDLPDLPPRMPKKKKDPAAMEEDPAVVPADTDKPEEPAKQPEEPVEAAKEGEEPPAAEGEKKKKKKRKRKKKKKEPSMGKRNLTQVFIRGDNIVMISIMDPDEEDEVRPSRRARQDSK